MANWAELEDEPGADAPVVPKYKAGDKVVYRPTDRIAERLREILHAPAEIETTVLEVLGELRSGTCWYQIDYMGFIVREDLLQPVSTVRTMREDGC